MTALALLSGVWALFVSALMQGACVFVRPAGWLEWAGAAFIVGGLAVGQWQVVRAIWPLVLVLIDGGGI